MVYGGFEMRIFICGVFILFFVFVPQSQVYEINSNEILLKAKEYIKEGVNSSDEAIFMETHAFLKKSNLSKSHLYHYYLALTEYHLALLNLKKKDKSKANEYIDGGIENLKTSIEIKEDFSESFVLLSSFTALKISIKPFLGPFLGPKSSRYLEKALELEPKNPRARLTKGIAFLNTPRLFGGDISKAIKELEMAINLFEEEKSKDSIMPDWGKGEAYLWLSHAYFKYGNKKKAMEVASEGISKCPDYLRLTKYLEKLKESKEED